MASQIEVALGNLMGIGRDANWGGIEGAAVKREIDDVARAAGETAAYGIGGATCYELAPNVVIVIVFDESVWRVKLSPAADKLFGEGAMWRALPQADFAPAPATGEAEWLAAVAAASLADYGDDDDAA